MALIAALPGESICPAQRALQGRRTAFPRIAPCAPWVARATSGCVPNQLFLAPTWTGEGEGSGLFDAAPRLRFAPCPRPLPFPASGPTGARPLAPFTYGICTRTEQGKKNTGQEQEQKTQNTPFPAVFYSHGRGGEAPTSTHAGGGPGRGPTYTGQRERCGFAAISRLPACHVARKIRSVARR